MAGDDPLPVVPLNPWSVDGLHDWVAFADNPSGVVFHVPSGEIVTEASGAVAEAEVSRPRQIHRVKCVQPHFEDVWVGRKTFEVRRDDRDYRSGDIIVQVEFDGRFERARQTVHVIGHVLRDFVGLRRGWCAFGLLEPTAADREAAEQ